MGLQCEEVEGTFFFEEFADLKKKLQLQGTNISHLGKVKIIFKGALVGDILP